MTQVIIGDLRTGRKILYLPVTKLTWTKKRNVAETIQATVPITSRMVQKMGLRSATAPAKAFIAVIENDIVMAAGPIWKRTQQGDTLQLSGSGVWSYFDHRQILPVLSDSANVIDAATGDAAVAANTDLVGYSYGTIAKRLIQQSLVWTGGNLPIFFQSDEAGPYERHYVGANLTKIGEALRQLTKLVEGIDIDFVPRRTADRRGIEWVLRTGTIAAPELHSPTVHLWDMSVPRPSVRSLIAIDDGSDMTAQAWTTGGRQDGSAVVERVRNASLIASGYPLLESVDSSHSDAFLSNTLLAYSRQAILYGRAPIEAWSFEVRATAVPKVGSYSVGDYLDLKVGPHPWVPPGTYRREIASISGNEKGEWVKIVTQEAIDA